MKIDIFLKVRQFVKTERDFISASLMKNFRAWVFLQKI